MIIAFDTNVVLDIFARCEKFPDSFYAYDIACIRHFNVVFPASATSDVFYILQKHAGKDHKAKEYLEDLFKLFTLYDVNQSDCNRALNSSMKDYEDALLCFSAERNNVDLILTRNEKDYKNSPVPFMTPKEFVKIYCPPDYEFSETSI